MTDDLNLLVTQFVTLWAVLEPISHLSMFMAVTSELSNKGRRRAAVLATFFAFLILVFFIVVGQALLEAMGISILSFQVAGGLILFVYAMTMIFTEMGKPQALEIDEDKHLAAMAVYPLATPVIAGPGAILSVMILANNNRHSIHDQVITITVVAALMVIMLVLFFLAKYLLMVIRQSGANLIRRIMGIILAALAVDIVLTSLAKWLNLPPI
ncbi:MarC family protein [Aquabacter sp. L1I39]|uniref:MarC family protein n=1 Tax=Aquabacter sp. L1I39 TaxID=2820278 RepID=UPI001ADA5B75|nr:MarC family protein [Aquabacter sp. L1I39]QTL04258.1 MarC family protein [Aquabacter sp. L1I39]